MVFDNQVPSFFFQLKRWKVSSIFHVLKHLSFQNLLLFLIKSHKTSTTMNYNRQIWSKHRNSPYEPVKRINNYVYQYTDLIGIGSFANVYKGLNIATQQLIAIKHIAFDDPKSKHLEEIAFEEIKLLQRMNHPNIIKFHEALISEKDCYIVTELCKQGTLSDRLKIKKPIFGQELENTIVGLYKGIKYLSEMGVIHRDIKPANIFINNGEVRIADFGFAKFYSQRFQDGSIGSPRYMSPEGLIKNIYSEKTDIWSMGIIIYELVHGVTPLAQCQTLQELSSNITSPIPVHKWRRDINPHLRQFISRLLQIDEYKRPNALQLANEPYLKMLLKDKNQVDQQFKFFNNISLSTSAVSVQNEERGQFFLGYKQQISQRPTSSAYRFCCGGNYSQNQQLQATTNSSVCFSESKRQKKFSFAKFNQNTQINSSQSNFNLAQKGHIYQPSKYGTYEESRKGILYAMSSQKAPQGQNQLIYVDSSRQKSSFRVNQSESSTKAPFFNFFCSESDYIY